MNLIFPEELKPVSHALRDDIEEINTFFHLLIQANNTGIVFMPAKWEGSILRYAKLRQRIRAFECKLRRPIILVEAMSSLYSSTEWWDISFRKTKKYAVLATQLMLIAEDCSDFVVPRHNRFVGRIPHSSRFWFRVSDDFVFNSFLTACREDPIYRQVLGLNPVTS
jgi:hypothetical protein